MNNIVKRVVSEQTYDRLWHCYYKFWERLFSLFPIKPNKVLITSYYGGDYGDNGKCIAEELLKQEPGLDLVWAIRKDRMEQHHLPDSIRAVPYYTPRGIYELQTAAVWIDNARKAYGTKRKGQYYLQTWHGGPGMKRVEQDVAEELGPRYVELAKKDSAMCDLIMSNSRFMTELYHRAFWYDGAIEEQGSPRNDALVNGNPQVCRKVRSFWGLSEDTRLILYAPTFRKDKRLDVYNLDPQRVIRAMEQRFGGHYALLVRLHPNISDKADLIQTDGKTVCNATVYPDMQELLVASDCLITDYSSSNFDFSLTGKPVFLYATDIEEYRQNRGYYFGFDEMPFPIARSNEELEKLISSFEPAVYQAGVEAFHQRLGVRETGHAAELAAKHILAHLRREPSQTLS